MNTTLPPASGKAGLLAVTLLLSFASCTPYMGYGGGYGSGYGGGYGGYSNYGYGLGLSSYIPRGNNYNYSYYPRYGAYYHRPTQQYYYQSGNQWLTGPRLPGYSHSTIQSSHSVPFNFNSHPSNYHSQVSHSFPHNWSPPGGGGSHGGSSSHGGSWGGSSGGSHGSGSHSHH